jgi:chaperone required for assembly of F1-ATPase
MADLAYRITAQDGRFCLARGDKVVKTGKGHDLITTAAVLAELTLSQLNQTRPRAFALGFWQAVLDAESAEIAHMRRTLLDGLEHDQLLYPAEAPADFVLQQEALWQAPKAWLQSCGVVSQPGKWQGGEVLVQQIEQLSLPALVWVYGASRLLQSTALGLWALFQPKTADELVKAGYSDEIFQQMRYTADDEVTARLERIAADLADLCLLRSYVVNAETL